ncbi:MAG: 4'-phosphopantetheinyl transferase [Chromatiales bacterium]|nr:4'-phosphopantetheinyl transferase [Chromatiales bacterium]
MVARKQPAKQCGANTADMQKSRGTRSESCLDLHRLAEFVERERDSNPIHPHTSNQSGQVTDLIGSRTICWHTQRMPQPPEPNDLKALLPAPVEAVLSTRAPSGESTLPDIERAALAAMQPKRRHEFIHGRTCARAALSMLDLPDQAIPVGTRREPVWPDGIVGSISHCGSLAAAAVARRQDLGALGIDLESDHPLDQALLTMICRAEEIERLQASSQPLLNAKLIFSAKESIYKCIWPTLRHFVDFQDVGIRMDTVAGTFAPLHWTDSLPNAVIQPIAGRYLLRNGWIMTAAWIPHPMNGCS